MQSPRVTVRSEPDGVCLVVCPGEFDLDTVAVLATACDGQAGTARLLVLDVTDVVFADSTFLNVLIRLRNTRPMVLAGPLPAQLGRVLEITGAMDVFEVSRTGRLRPPDDPFGRPASHLGCGGRTRSHSSWLSVENPAVRSAVSRARPKAWRCPAGSWPARPGPGGAAPVMRAWSSPISRGVQPTARPRACSTRRTPSSLEASGSKPVSRRAARTASMSSAA